MEISVNSEAAEGRQSGTSSEQAAESSGIPSASVNTSVPSLSADQRLNDESDDYARSTCYSSPPETTRNSFTGAANRNQQKTKNVSSINVINGSQESAVSDSGGDQVISGRPAVNRLPVSETGDDNPDAPPRRGSLSSVGDDPLLPLNCSSGSSCGDCDFPPSSVTRDATRSDCGGDNGTHRRPVESSRPTSGFDEWNGNGASNERLTSKNDGRNEDGQPFHDPSLYPMIHSSSSDSEFPPPKQDFFVDVKTMRQCNPKWLHGTRVLSSLVNVGSGGMPNSPKDLLEELQKNRSPEKPENISKMALKQIRDLTSRRQFRDLALFLQAKQCEDPVLSSLETILLDLQNSQDRSVTEGLLETAVKANSAFLQLYERSPLLLPTALLQIMCVSAVLSRCELPNQEQQKALASVKKQMKELSYDGPKQMAVKGLQLFYDGLKEVMNSKVSSFQQWSQTGFSDEVRVKKKNDFTRTSFCELIIHIFTIFNEVKNSPLNEHTQSLLNALSGLYDTTINSRKHNLGDEPRNLLDFCLVRWSAKLLQSTFDGEESQVGESCSEHAQLITSLITSVIKAAHPSFKPCLLREIECLAFHMSTHVKKAFNVLFSDEKRPPQLLIEGHMKKNLQVIRFHGHSESTELNPKSGKSREKCGWKTFTSMVGGKQAQVTMYIPTAECMARNDLDKCCSQHPGNNELTAKARDKVAEKSRQNCRNLDVLKEISTKSKHMLQLYAYQMMPFPFFVTEGVEDSRLLKLLLDHRNAEQWLRDIDIHIIMHQVIDVLLFLSKHNLDPRNMTAYNMIVQPAADSNRRKTFSECLSVLTSPGFILKLVDLGLAHEFRDKDNEILRVHSHGQVPTRWTSPEALFEGKYGEKNMTHAAGCLLYEVATHGRQPFSSYDKTMDTVELIKRRFTDPDDIRLDQMPCISSEVHSLITRWTHHNPDNRPTLLECKTELSKLSLAQRQQASNREPRVDTAFSLARKYGEISPDQCKRNHIPETGIPESLEELIYAGKNSSLYNQYRNSTRTCSSQTVVTDQELQAADWIHIDNQGEDRTVVKEVVSTRFVEEKLPSLEGSKAVNLGRMDDYYPRPTRREDGRYIYKREYPPGQTLKKAVMNKLLRHTEEESDHYDEVSFNESGLRQDFLFVPLSLAKEVEAMHKKGWIHRDLKEDNILIGSRDGQVKFLRLGRMDRLTSPETSVVGDVFDDNRRWQAPEVLSSGRYSKESDMFMVGTVFAQVFRIDDIIDKNPQASDRDLAPHSNIDKDKVIDYIRGPGREELPTGLCPMWLHELILKCRDPDPARRPTAQELVNILQARCPQGPPPSPFLSYSMDRQTATEVADVQMRKKAKPHRPEPLKPKRGLWKSLKNRVRSTRKKGGTTKNRVTVCTVPQIIDITNTDLFATTSLFRRTSYVLETSAGSVDPHETLVKTIAQDRPIEAGQTKHIAVGDNISDEVENTRATMLGETSKKTTENTTAHGVPGNSYFPDPDQTSVKTVDDPYEPVESSSEENRTFHAKEAVDYSTLRFVPPASANINVRALCETHPRVTHCTNSYRQRPVSADGNQETSWQDPTDPETSDGEPATNPSASVAETKRARPQRRRKRRNRKTRGCHDNDLKRVKSSRVRETPANETEGRQPATSLQFGFAKSPGSTQMVLRRNGELWQKAGYLPNRTAECPEEPVPDYPNMDDDADIFNDTSRGVSSETLVPCFRNMDAVMEIFSDSSEGCVRTQETSETQNIHSQTPPFQDNCTVSEHEYEASNEQVYTHDYEPFQSSLYNEAASKDESAARCSTYNHLVLSPARAEQSLHEQTDVTEFSEHEEGAGLANQAASDFPLFPSEMQRCSGTRGGQNTARRAVSEQWSVSSATQTRFQRRLDPLDTGQRMTLAVCSSVHPSSF